MIIEMQYKHFMDLCQEMAGVRADGENIFLSKRAKLCLRVRKDHADKIREIEGKKIKLFGNELNIGKSKIKSFLVVRDLFCRFVSCNEDLPEENFLEEVQTELRAYKVNINKALCGQSKRISFGEKSLYTRSLMIADLTKEEAVILQEEGVGKHRLFGCCLLYTSPSPRDVEESRMPSSA